ncbi:hypothetical protein ADK43_30395 [Streptomyces rimosus subsp. rimosus]|nr:hypothetical protein ADK43_30395 [Streptomyces rimosus subsp. rimosus]
MPPASRWEPPVSTSPSDRVLALVARAADLADVRGEVEANHDDNRWWPTAVTDFRVRMLAAGWSSRVSYRMIDAYARVIRDAAALGFDALADSTDAEVASLVAPLGLPRARIAYLRSLSDITQQWAKDGIAPATDPLDADAMIRSFAEQVHGASYKVAQCALLYARGYHCGIIPVDSGMVSKLAPALGLALPPGPAAHEQMRHHLEAAVRSRPSAYRALAARHALTLPADAAPTWWTHLVLIYFKRLYLNRPSPRLCPQRPLCASVLDCTHLRP